MALVGERDAGALDALYDRYGAASYSLARRTLDEALAVDVVRAVFLALWADAGRFDAARGTVGTYLLASTRRRVVEVVRGQKGLRRGRAGEEALGFEVDPSSYLEPELRSDAGRDPAGARRAARVRAALDALPERQRHIMALAYFGGYTQREIAALIGEPLSVVRSGMAVAMRGVRDTLDGREREQSSGWTTR